MQNIKIVIGLGNPDIEYEKTYHNVGHIFIDFTKEELRIKNKELLKTAVFMNKSGLFIKENLKKESAKPEELLIIHDDSDIELGKFKLSFGRNSAGHKGVQSIIDALKSQKIWRLRIGARNEKNKTKAGQFVLQPINQKDKEKLEVTQDKVFSNLYKIPK